MERNGQNMSKKRYLELDRQNVLFCLIVVFIHAFGTIGAKLNSSSYWYILSQAVLKNCAFVVQGFMFLSAAKYVAVYKDRKLDFPRFLIGRIKKVIIPYILCTLVYYGVFLRFGIIQKADYNELAGYILRGDLSAQFYFIIAIVQFYLLMPLWIFISKKLPEWIIIGGGLVIYILWVGLAFGYTVYYDRIFLSYLPFWTFGLAFGKSYDKFKGFITGHLGITGILYVLLFCINGFAGQVFTLSPYLLEAIHTIYAFGAILLSYGIFLNGRGYAGVLTSGINKLSFEIYLWHCLALKAIDWFINKMSLPRISQEAIVRVGGIYLIIFAVSLFTGLMIKIKKRKR